MHSAMRGSNMALTGIFAVLANFNVSVPMGFGPSHASFPALVMAVAAFGFYSQLGRGFGLPFPFNILLMPLRLLEFALAWAMAYAPK